jgi:hypothetical protein
VVRPRLDTLNIGTKPGKGFSVGGAGGKGREGGAGWEGSEETSIWES